MQLEDQLGTIHQFDQVPRRIISLVPSITELLCDMGLDSDIVGCTKFCVHPAGFKKKVPIIGGTKQVKIDRVKDQSPDIIIGNKEENNKEDIDAIRTICPVWMSDIKTTQDSFEMIQSMGQLFDKQARAEELISLQQELIHKIEPIKGTVAYLIWKDPMMTIGSDTYIHHMLEVMGLRNAFGSTDRYPEITIEDLIEHAPDHIFLSSEPFPFKSKHVQMLVDQLGCESVHLVDGEFFSWYGSRLLNCDGYPQQLHRQING